MKLSLENTHFCISEIQHDMMQNIINGLANESKKYDNKIEWLNDCIKQETVNSEIEKLDNILNYIFQKNKEINDLIENFNLII